MALFVFYTTCLVNGSVGAALLVLDYLSYAFLFYVSGYAIAINNIYYSFLLSYQYLFAWWIFWTLSSQYPQPQPPCDFIDPAVLVEVRQRGWPALDTLLITTAITFLLGKQLLGEGGLPLKLQFFTLLLYPFWIVGDLVSRNATVNQLAAAVLIGTTTAGFLVILFHYVARTYYHSLYALPIVGPLLFDPPELEKLEHWPEDSSVLDHDVLMMFAAVKAAKQQPVQDMTSKPPAVARFAFQ